MTDLQNLSENIASEIRTAEESIQSDTAQKMNKEALKVEEKRIEADVAINNRQAERDENIAEMQLGVQEYRSMLDEMLAKFNNLFSSVNPQQSSGDVIVETTTPIAPSSEDSAPIVPPEIDEPEQIPEEIGEDLNKETEEVKEEINGPTRKRGRRTRKR